MSDQAPPPPPPPGGSGEPPQTPGSGEPPPGYGQQPPAYGQGGYGAPPPPAYGAPPSYGGGAPVNTSKATWALILGILSLVCCGLVTGIPAIIMGRSAKAELEAAGQSGTTANIGFILGIIGTVLSIIGLIVALTTGSFTASVN